MQRLLGWAVLTLVCLSCGCRNDDLVLAPVSGTVTMNGGPLARAKVMFQPAVSGRAPSAEGTTDAKGRYRLMVTVLEREGAMPGLHKVTIYAETAPTSSDDTIVAAAEPVPERYNVRTILTFEVPPEGTATADFKLESP